VPPRGNPFEKEEEKKEEFDMDGSDMGTFESNKNDSPVPNNT